MIITNAIPPNKKKTGPKKNPYVFTHKNLAREIAREEGLIIYNRGVSCKNGHDGLRYVKNNHCVECEKKAKNTHRKITKNEWATNLKRNYGITLQEYLNILSRQNNKCVICESDFSTIKACVDHCHDTKKIRGILCHNCNVAIGHLKHNPELLRKAAIYCEEV